MTEVASERKWIFYDNEETELLIQLTSYAFGYIVLECTR
jgi:hypothetical protein